ncbi:MAG: pilus assembly protein PilQ, partial [Neisseriaceae bacterium]|nr:pilus assembly protein PilQ [Neisseriaceae bacterium]
VSSPRVLTQDRQEASLEEGQDVPYQESTSSGATSTTFKKAVTGLTVTPQITPDGNVIMKLKINKDEVDTRYNDGRMNVKRVETTAMVENGGTIVIGGIYVEKDSNGVASVPLLGDIPILGNLFKHTSRNKERRELLIFITPRILDTVGGNLDY